MNKTSCLYQVVQLLDVHLFDKYANQIKTLLNFYHHVLVDGTCEAGCDTLLDNLRESVPHVWLLLSNQQVVALCNLSDEMINRHVFIHGLSYPEVWQSGHQTDLAMTVMHYAFDQLNVLKVKAEFELGNKTAKGFCWRFGFKKEGHFKNDTLLSGQLSDVVIYSLTRKQFMTIARGCKNTIDEKENINVIRT